MSTRTLTLWLSAGARHGHASPTLHLMQAAVWLELVCVGAPAAATNGAELGIELALQWRARACPPPACGGAGVGEGAEEDAEGIVEEGQGGGAAASGVAASGAAAGGTLGAVPLRLVLAVACTGAELSLLVSRDDAREVEEARRRRAKPPPRLHPATPTLQPRLFTPEHANPTVTPAGTHLLL